MTRPKPKSRTCTASGKHRFRDGKEAHKAVHRAQWARAFATEHGLETRRQERRAYPCGACAGWHLTSQEAPPPAPTGRGIPAVLRQALETALQPLPPAAT